LLSDRSSSSFTTGMATRATCCGSQRSPLMAPETRPLPPRRRTFAYRPYSYGVGMLGKAIVHRH
jgi:hypothetical protein